MKILHYATIAIVSLIFCTGLSPAGSKPHLIVGGWKTNAECRVSLPAGNNMSLQQWTFRGDGFTSNLLLESAEPEEKYYSLAYTIKEKDNEQEFPFLICKSTCDTGLLLVFAIQHLDKGSLHIKFESRYSKEGIFPAEETITFTRISGPSENMD